MRGGRASLGRRAREVAAVGVWLEEAGDREEPLNAAAVAAELEEERLSELFKEKRERLRRFQQEVQRRVTEQARLKRDQQLQSAVHEFEKISHAASLADGFLSKRDTCLFRDAPGLQICSPQRKGIRIPAAGHDQEELGKRKHPLEVPTFRRQAMDKLATRKIEPGGSATSDLPGDFWKVAAFKDNHTSRQMPVVPREPEIRAGDESEDEWTELVDVQDPQEKRVQGPLPNGVTSAVQKQTRYSMLRRVFQDLERERVKEHCRQKEHQKRMARIRAAKERAREIEERKIVSAFEEERERKRLIRSKDEQQKVTVTKELQRNKETVRFIEALRMQTLKEIEKKNILLPPMCFCGDSFWDSHPDRCANNCAFYKNEKAYAQALRSVLASCNMRSGPTRSLMIASTTASLGCN
ncbi:coiled-coil domain-containing protein 15 isoform X1 [Lampetra fluviatilis]